MNKKITFKQIQIVSLIISGVIAFVGDLIYGSKAQAEEYLFGNFMINTSVFGFTIFSIITLISLVFYALCKLNPVIMEKIKFEEEPKAYPNTKEVKAK